MSVETQPSKVIQGVFFPREYLISQSEEMEKFKKATQSAIRGLFAEHDDFCQCFSAMRKEIEKIKAHVGISG